MIIVGRETSASASRGNESDLVFLHRKRSAMTVEQEAKLGKWEAYMLAKAASRGHKTAQKLKNRSVSKDDN